MTVKLKYILLLLLGTSLFSCKEKDSERSTLYISTSNDDLYSINLKTDQLNWSIPGDTGRTELSFFSLKGDKIIKAYTDKHIIEASKQTGKISWTYQDKLSDNHGYYHYDFSKVIDAFFSQYPVLYQNKMIYAGTQGEIKAVGLNTKKVNWTHQLSIPIDFSPSIIGNKLVLNLGYRIITLDPNSGKLLEGLDFKTPIPNETTVDGNYIYVADEYGKAFALDSSLNQIWTFAPKNQDAGSSKIITDRDKLLYGYRSVILLDKKTGKADWEITLPGDVIARSLEINGDEISIGALNGIFVLDAGTGKILRQKHVAKNMVGMMCYANGFYYYWCTDNVLYKTTRDLEEDKVIYKAKKTITELTGTYMLAE